MPEPREAIVALGWNARWDEVFEREADRNTVPGRVGVEDKHHYQIFAEAGVFTGRITARFRSRARVPADYPKVGDWVSFSLPEPEGLAHIHQVLPRRTRLARKRKGRETREQVLVTNVDVAFIVHGLDRELNVRLIERFLVMTREGGVQPVVLLNKTDLDSRAAATESSLREALGDVPIHTTCARTALGVAGLKSYLAPGKTVVFMGASGVGKSSLINRLYGEEVQATAEVRESDAKGRHTTTWREMVVLPDGALVIDTPGMREFHMWMSGEGIHEAFPEIEPLALQCHFRDCSHTVEKRCAVIAAVQAGRLSQERYQSFLKLSQELAFLERAHRHQDRQVRRRDSLLRRRSVLDKDSKD
ncbi:MAG: ribosome small subunit-dependent GTPase A [Verrucomicrobia bacterium]|jgi:ribosome biogenesis GTPase|nr:ribosome small subunit-dependent GTPase A [Verrucomicrobiota bacterium]